MNRISSISFLAAMAASGLAIAAPAYTTPVGYVNIGNTSNLATNLANNTDILVSIPLVQATEWAGVVASVSGQVITLQGSPAWTVNQYSTNVPYVVTIASGNGNGITALIVSNTNGTLTVDSAFDITSLAAADKIVIRKATTLGNFFSGNTLPSGLQVQIQSGTAVGTNLAFDKVYSYFGNWYTSTFVNADNVILYPGESFLVRNTTGTAITSLTVSGEVPMQNQRVLITGESVAQDNVIGYTAPVGETLADAGLVGAAGDQILVYDNTTAGTNKAAAAVYTSFGGPEWYSSTFVDVKSTLKIGSGVGLIYRRAAGKGDLDFKDQPTYVPSL